MESDSSAICSDTSIGKLKELLRLESRSHRDTGQCYDTLQKEYDDLLRKYAEAENTIDKLRIDTLRERIEKRREGEEDVTESSARNSNIWKCLYDDLLGRTNKLQNAVTDFQAHLASHEFAGEELNDIFDRLHNDFENIANAFQSMQALGNKVANPNEKYPEESLLADDLEGNLYRLGLRLEEIQDEIGDQLRTTLKVCDGTNMEQNQMPTLSNNSGSLKMTHNTDSKKGYEGECSETETTKGEDNIESDEDNNLRLDDWRPVTDDLTELTFYKKQNEFLGLDPKYLSRSFSEPSDLVNLQKHGNITLIPNDFVEDPPAEQGDSRDSQRSIKSASPSFDSNSANKRKKTSSRKIPTVALERLNLKKSPPSKVETNLAPSHPNTLTSPEDSGYLEGSQPGQQGFPPRYVGSPLRNHSRINEGETTSFDISPSHDTIMEESAGEQYRQRLDSLRGYIRAKRAANNSPSFSASETDKKAKNFVRGKKPANLNYRNSPRSSPPRLPKLNAVPKVNASYNVNDPGSSTTESMFSGITQPADEETMANRKLTKEEKPAIQRQDIETLRDEMRGVKDIVLDLKDSLTSPNRSPSKIPVANRVNESPKSRSVDNVGKDETDTKPTAAEQSQLQLQQNKQFEMLEKLESKLDDIAKKMRNTTLNRRQSLSRESARNNTDRSHTPREINTSRSPKDNYEFSYNHGREDEDVNILKVGPRSPHHDGREMVDEYDACTERRLNTQAYSERSGGELRDSPGESATERKHINNTNLYQRSCSCNNCKIARDNCVISRDNCAIPRDNCAISRDNCAISRDNCAISRDNCVIARDNDNTCHNTKDRHAQVYTNRSSYNNTPLSNHRGGVTSFTHPVGEDNTNSTYLVEEGKDTPVSRGQRKNFDSNGFVKSYHEKFEEIGEQINRLTSHMKECKVKEEERMREETAKKQKMLVKALEEKLEGLSTKIEENEKKTVSDSKPVNVSPGAMYVIACPVCGCVGAHRHGSYIFNGHTIEPVNENTLTSPINSVRPTVEVRHASTTTSPLNSVRPGTGSKQDESFWMHSTPKTDFHQHSNGESLSPTVYHHYHTIVSPPPQDEPSRQTKGRNTRDLMIGDRVQDSLEKASLAALHMETLSKKMLHGIANDLFNYGPSEF